MQLQTLRTFKWRNIQDELYEFSPGVNVLVGGNGEGKTNLLEAIQYLALGRSHRGARDEEICRFGEDQFLVAGQGLGDAGQGFSIEAQVTLPRRKQIKIDNETIGRLTDLTGILACVSFGPEDTELARGSPEHRRRFIDYALAETSRSALRTLAEYRRAQQQRASLLRGEVSGMALEDAIRVWDDALVTLGCEVIRLRAQALVEMAPRVQELYALLSGGLELRLNYEIQALGTALSVGQELQDFLDTQAGEPLETAFRQRLRERWVTEKLRRRNLVGPHRDDIHMWIDGRELRKYGSQGQCRAAAITLKMSQAEFIMSRRNDRPIVVLDDVFAELDENRARALWDIICQRHQTFLAVPRQSDLIFGEGDRVFTVQAGRLSIK